MVACLVYGLRLLCPELVRDHSCVFYAGPWEEALPCPSLWKEQFPYLTSHCTTCTAETNGPCLCLLLLKPRGGFFSERLMGDVSISSNWVLLQNKMPFKNQCSLVCSSSLSPLHNDQGTELNYRALQQLGNNWQQGTLVRDQNLIYAWGKGRENHLL